MGAAYAEYMPSGLNYFSGNMRSACIVFRRAVESRLAPDPPTQVSFLSQSLHHSNDALKEWRVIFHALNLLDLRFLPTFGFMTEFWLPQRCLELYSISPWNHEEIITETCRFEINSHLAILNHTLVSLLLFLHSLYHHLIMSSVPKD